MNSIGDTSGTVGQIFRGVVTAVLITLVGVLVFAFVLSVTDLSDSVIKPVNQFIKLLSVFFGCFLSVGRERGLIKGGLIGLLSAVFSVLLFALISGSSISWITVLIDSLFGTAMGCVSGVITSIIKLR